jgi:hypothetical protein
VKSKILLLIAVAFFSGCAIPVEREESVFNRYYVTMLKFTSSSDILGMIHEGEEEILSQSESVVASWGEKEDGKQFWFNIVSFDEEELKAIRKYAFLVDEKTASGWFVLPKYGPSTRLRFDAQAVVDAEVLDEPYPNDNFKKIAILRDLAAGFSDDIGQLTAEGRTLRSSSMMIKQAVNAVLTKLDISPALAIRLAEPAGLSFDHMTIGKSKVRMLIEDDIVKLKIKCGKDWFLFKKFEEHLDVINM